jgi:hypothetical protein
VKIVVTGVQTCALPICPAAEAFLDALALCEKEGVAKLWVNDPLGLFPPDASPDAGTALNRRLSGPPSSPRPRPCFLSDTTARHIDSKTIDDRLERDEEMVEDAPPLFGPMR